MYLYKYFLVVIACLVYGNSDLSATTGNNVAQKQTDSIKRNVLLSAARKRAIVKSLEYSCDITASVKLRNKPVLRQRYRINVGTLNGYYKVESLHHNERGGWALDNNWSLTILTPDSLTAVDLDARMVKFAKDSFHLNPSSNRKILPVVNSIYCECILFWCGDLTTQPRTRTLFDILVNNSTKIRVDPNSHTIYATTKNSDVILKYSPEYDYAITEWEIKQPDGNIRYICSEYFEVYDGVWFPKKVSRKMRVYDENGVELKALEISAALLHINLNNLSKKDFFYVPPPGSVVFDVNSETNHIVPDGLDHFISKIDNLCLFAYSDLQRLENDFLSYIKIIVTMSITVAIVGLYTFWVDRRQEQASD